MPLSRLEAAKGNRGQPNTFLVEHAENAGKICYAHMLTMSPDRSALKS